MPRVQKLGGKPECRRFETETAGPGEDMSERTGRGVKTVPGHWETGHALSHEFFGFPIVFFWVEGSREWRCARSRLQQSPGSGEENSV